LIYEYLKTLKSRQICEEIAIYLEKVDLDNKTIGSKKNAFIKNKKNNSYAH